MSECSDSLRQIYFVITRRCNLTCSHCIRSSDPYQRDGLTLEDATRVLKGLAPYATEAELAVTGGEPTLHSDFAAIVACAARLYPGVCVNTNGLRVSSLEAVLREHENVRVQVSLDGDPHVHDRVRGAGTFARTALAIERLRPFARRVVVATTVGRSNVASLPSMDRALASLPFARWTLKREVVYGRATAVNGLTTGSWNRAAEGAHRFANAGRIEVSGMFHPDTFAGSHAYESLVPDWTANCGTGRSKLYVNPDLTVFPCACLEDVALGDLRLESAGEVVSRMRSLDVAPRAGGKCETCPLVSPCQGGCPGASLRVHGAFGFGDPRCPVVSGAGP